MDTTRNRCVNLSIKKLDRLTTSHYNKYLKPLGIRITQFSVLSFIHEKQMAASTDIEELLNLDQTTVSRAIKNLKCNDLVSTNDKNSNKITYYKLSAKGEKIYRKAFSLWVEAQQALTDKIGMDTKEDILKVADKTIRNLAE
ncbi:MAG: MarR family winged helix-turn-helix transcriptional regulator [Pseudomonadota bacterium]